MSLKSVSENATATHATQQKKVLGYSGVKHDIPGDYTMSPGSVPVLPGGVEAFGSQKEENNDMNTVGYLSVFTGISCLFMASVRLSLSLTSPS
jgi:hypothetical protein